VPIIVRRARLGDDGSKGEKGGGVVQTWHDDGIGGLIPAIGQLSDELLRRAVTSCWAEALRLSPYESLDQVPQSPVMLDRSLLDHVNEVNGLCLTLLDVASLTFALTPDRDVTLATAILHDLDKPLLFRRSESGAFACAEGRQMTEHGAIGADLAASLGVPDAIVALVRRHSPFASEGLPAIPEGTIVHYADFVANDLACLQVGATPIHASVRMVPRHSSDTAGIAR
jgi:putative nucleotidyltransferase with HDIG domain